MRRLLGLLTVLVLVLPAAGAAEAGPPAKFRDVVNDALVLGADEHLDDQGTHLNVPFGHDVDDAWEWIIDSGNTYPNVDYGVSGWGLLGAYERTRDPAYLQGAVHAGEHLVDRYTIGEFATDRPYPHDIVFLHWLSDLTRDRSYADAATSIYQRVVDEFTPAENVQRHLDAPRRSITGWDIAAQVIAAWESSFQWYAEEMLRYLIAHRTEWEHQPLGGTDYTTSSYGALLWAMDGIRGGEFRAFRDELTRTLTSSQEADGSWESGDYQTTAYVVLGLDATPRRPGVQSAVRDGLNYLVSAQDAAGGWTAGSGTGAYQIGEVNSEVLTALGTVRVDNGRHRGFVDPRPGRGNDTHLQPFDPGS